MRYRVLHQENGQEIEFAEYRQIDKVRNHVSMMLWGSARRLGYSTSDSTFKDATKINTSLNSKSFPWGCVVITLREATIRIDQVL